MNGPRVIDLIEYEASHLTREELPQEIAEELYRRYPKQLEIDFPSIRTRDRYRIIPQGWVGYIPVSDEISFRLNPKVPVHNLFGMIEYAFRLRGFHRINELMGASSLSEMYSELASLFARRIGARWRRGLHRAYVQHEERLPALRGRLQIAPHLREPWTTHLPCVFEEHTSDIEDNRLLAWTLHCLVRAGSITERVRPTVRHAYQRLQSAAAIAPFKGSDCLGRQYDRLNADYELLHALCRFFLECSGPSHAAGDRQMLPFLIDMAGLFELFVAEWLQVHLPAGFSVQAQRRMTIGEDDALDFHIDLVIAEVATGATRFVLDTKYKAGPVTPPDVYQIVTYATAMYCVEALLIYPQPLGRPLDQRVGGIRVRSATFDVSGDLELAGGAFLAEVLGPISA